MTENTKKLNFQYDHQKFQIFEILNNPNLKTCNTTRGCINQLFAQGHLSYNSLQGPCTRGLHGSIGPLTEMQF